MVFDLLASNKGIFSLQVDNIWWSKWLYNVTLRFAFTIPSVSFCHQIPNRKNARSWADHQPLQMFTLFILFAREWFICAVVLQYFQLPTITNYQCNITSLRSYFAIFPTCAKLLDFRVSWAQAVIHPSEHVMPGWCLIMMMMTKMMIAVMMMMIWLPNDGYFRKHVMPGW